MKTIQSTKEFSISRSTGEQSLVRSLQFLRTVGIDPAIRASLQTTGFSLADLKEGWALVLKAYAAPQATTTFTHSTGPVVDTTQKIEDWQSTMFLRTHAALRRLHPEQDEFVFENLASGSGVIAVAAVSTFLDRLDALQNSPGRKATRKADHLALETLSQRGVTDEERKLARGLVHTVESTTAPAAVEVPTDARDTALVDVYRWIQDWSDSARAVITRRDQLLRLGIGKRHARAVAQPAPIAVPQLPPAPAPAASAPTVVDVMQPAFALLPQKANGSALPMSR